MTTTISEIATYVPGQRRLRDHQEELGLTAVEVRRFERIFGYDRIAHDPTQTETDLLLGAATKLEGLRGAEHRITYVLRPRSVRFPSLHPDSALTGVCAALGLQGAQRFAITDQVCAGGLLAVDMAGALLREDGDPAAMALVLVGEKASCPITQVIPGMALLGEACAAMLITLDGHHDRVLSYATTTVPITGGGLVMDRAAVRAFGEVYAEAMRETVFAALRSAGLSPGDLDLYLPHNVGKRLSLTVGAACGFRPEQVVTDTVGEIGHCWGADPFYNNRWAVDMGRLAPGDRYLMTSAAMGSTFAAMIVER